MDMNRSVYWDNLMAKITSKTIEADCTAAKVLKKRDVAGDTIESENADNVWEKWNHFLTSETLNT